MIHTAKTVRTLETIAVILGLSILIWSTGLPTIFHFAKATAIADARDTVSDVTPLKASNHSIEFEIPQGMQIGETIVFTFPTAEGEFIFGSLGEDDIDILIDGLSESTASVSDAGTWGVAVKEGSITLTTPTNSGVGPGTSIVVRIGSNAVDFGTGSHQIINPSHVASHVISIGGTMQDAGEIVVAIIDRGTTTRIETPRTYIRAVDTDSATTDSDASASSHQIITPTF